MLDFASQGEKRGAVMDDRPCQVYIVSCDIVGHSREADHHVQVRRIVGLNGVVREALGKLGDDGAVWASGGDGGHVLLGLAHLEAAIDLAAALWLWAQDERVPLRVTCHVGTVSYCLGADGRPQPVGQGINHAGAILAAAGDRGIVVSAEFRDVVEAAAMTVPQFREPRILSWRNKGSHRVCLMSLPGIESHWPEPAEPPIPSAAVGRASAWDSLYLAKQRLQINAADGAVDRTLRLIKPEDLWYECSGQNGERAVNPFLGYLDQRSLREVVRVGHLVERGYNQVLCHYGDDGNTMFVILRGQVGIFHATDGGNSLSREPDFVMQQGQIVGELAFALNRRRTADLVTLSDTALLAFSFEDFLARLAMTPRNEKIRGRVDDFITARVLEHVATNVDYLVGHDHTGPLAQDDVPWESLLEDVQSDCRVLTCQSSEGPVTLDSLAGRYPDSEGRGLFVLVSGALTSRSNSRKQLRGEDLPLVYANLPGRLVFPDHEYALSSGPGKLLHIGASALRVLPEATQDAVVSAVKGDIATRYFYDVFMSYNFEDQDTIRRWSGSLRAAGLEVFVDEPKPGTHFTANIESSLLDSLVMLVFVSPQMMVESDESNWVQKEMDFRRANFAEPWIVPVGLPGGDMNKVKVRYSAIDATTDEQGAIARAIATVRAIREGRDEPPLLSSGPRIEQSFG